MDCFNGFKMRSHFELNEAVLMTYGGDLMKYVVTFLGLFVALFLFSPFSQAWTCDGCQGDCETIAEVNGYGLCAPDPGCCCCAASGVDLYCDQWQNPSLCFQAIYTYAWMCGLPLPNPLNPFAIAAVKSEADSRFQECGPPDDNSVEEGEEEENTTLNSHPEVQEIPLNTIYLDTLSKSGILTVPAAQPKAQPKGEKTKGSTKLK